MTNPLPAIILQSRELGIALGLPELPTESDDSDAWLLFRDEGGLAIRRADGVRVNAEFVRGRNAARVREAHLASQPLARALGIARLAASSQHVSLVDATAGLGVDAWQAAALGAEVTLLEQHPIVHVLLADALQRARACEDARVRSLAERVQLERTDARTWLTECAERGVVARPHIVYLDPMYPAQRRRARSRKGIESLHALVPPGGDEGLLDAALRAATARVVVKRPSGAPPLESNIGLKPDAFNAPNTRWDRYNLPWHNIASSGTSS